MKARSPGFAHPELLAVVLMALACAGLCVALFDGCAATKQIAVDVAAKCAVPAIANTVTGLLPEVEAAIEGSEANWQSEIARLEMGGIDLAICAIETAVSDLQHKARLAEHRAEQPAIDLGVARGRAYLAAKGVK